MDRYKNIKTKENYDKLLKSGMFWEFHPELTGDWNKDKGLLLKSIDILPIEEKNRLLFELWKKLIY
jgi:hypothetical protein